MSVEKMRSIAADIGLNTTRFNSCIDTDKYIDFYAEYIDRGTVNSIAAFVLEPIQGWGGSIMPPDDFFPKPAQARSTRPSLRNQIYLYISEPRAMPPEFFKDART
jgi:hypothetical protein